MRRSSMKQNTAQPPHSKNLRNVPHFPPSSCAPKMATDSRELRRLMRRHRIFFKSSVTGAGVPLAHKETFEDIATLGSSRFDTYCTNIDVRLRQEPWRRHTKARVQWLSKRAAELFEQKRNEAGWRFGLENHVLLRFQSEVVW